MILKKRAVLGLEETDETHIAILNRFIDVGIVNGAPAIFYEPDSRHADLVIEQLGLSASSKGVSTPGEPRGDYHDLEEL
eukprot:2857170-Amphidinium_carterae.2